MKSLTEMWGILVLVQIKIDLMENYLAYLDESGGHGFNFKAEGTTTHLAYLAELF